MSAQPRVPLRRSNHTTINGQQLPSGKSGSEIQRDMYDQYDNVRNPYKDETSSIEFLEKKNKLYNQWALEHNTGTTTESFADFAASHSFGRGGKHRRRPSRKYKKSKRVFRKKSRSTRRR
jgi:hypothetical protein